MAKVWEDFKAAITRLVEEKIGLYYRGQRQDSWILETTFHRKAEALGITINDYLTIIVPEVRRHVCAWTNERINTSDPEENGAFFALLQHHGFPTPLLDWTLSPYIAAYFAFREVDDKNPQTDNVKIYAFDASQWRAKYAQPMDLIKDTAPFVSVFLPLARFNPRLIPQRGAYTLSNVKNIGAHIKAAEEKAKTKYLYEMLIPVREKQIVMRELDLMGINEMTLFPGLDGICNTMKHQFFTPAEMGPTPSELNQVLIKRIKEATKNDQPSEENKKKFGQGVPVNNQR